MYLDNVSIDSSIIKRMIPWRYCSIIANQLNNRVVHRYITSGWWLFEYHLMAVTDSSQPVLEILDKTFICSMVHWLISRMLGFHVPLIQLTLSGLSECRGLMWSLACLCLSVSSHSQDTAHCFLSIRKVEDDMCHVNFLWVERTFYGYYVHCS